MMEIKITDSKTNQIEQKICEQLTDKLQELELTEEERKGLVESRIRDHREIIVIYPFLAIIFLLAFLVMTIINLIGETVDLLVVAIVLTVVYFAIISSLTVLLFFAREGMPLKVLFNYRRNVLEDYYSDYYADYPAGFEVRKVTIKKGDSE